MDKTRTAFQKALEYIINEHGWGAQTKLSKAINISQQMISMIQGGTSEGSEDTRRKIAAFYGFEYEDFLRLGRSIREMGASESFQIGATADAVLIKPSPISKETTALLNKARKILDSGAPFAESLKSNIESLHSALAQIETQESELARFKKGRSQNIEPFEEPDRRKSDQPDKIPISGDRRKVG